MMETPVVAKTVKYLAVPHEAANSRVTHVQWLVEITNLDGTTSMCCNSTYGHKTKAAAKNCLIREMNRRISAL